MSVKTPDWERFDFFFDPRYFLRFSDETDVFGCMTRSCSWVRHRDLGVFFGGFDDLNAWFDEHHFIPPLVWLWCWYFGGSVKCLSKACVLSDVFFLVKCVKIPLGGFVWFIWMHLNIKSLSWTVDNFISPALDRSSEWRNAYWQFTILIPPFACSGN